MGKRFISLFIYILFCGIVAMAASHKFTLVIDAGHGGHDAGAVGAISKEKDINLNTALAFGRYVERNCSDVQVIYTRKTDVFVTLHGRAEIANKAKADLFISIHTNALEKGKIARGLETYTLGMHRAADNLDVAKRENSVILVEKDYKQHYEGFDPNSSESYIIFEFMQDNNMARSVELAKNVQSNVCSYANRPNKGVKQAGFLVLRETTMPSCLIELGYISTRDEEQWLNNDANIDALARGIFQAFVAYKNKYDNNAKVKYDAIETLPAPQKETQAIVSEPQKEPVKVVASKKKTEKKEPDEMVPAKKELPKAEPEKKSNGNNEASKAVADNKEKQEKQKKEAPEKPVFKIQIFVSDKILKDNDSRFKGEKADYYKDGKAIKYTIGASEDYNEINQMRKSVAEKFPGAFIVAFKNGEKINVNDAIKEFKEGKKK